MEIIALIGSSGTGKSHRAILVAHEHRADAIVDDGLLIKDSSILAGQSAKRQATKVGAIKTALFTDEEHALEVKTVIQRIKPSCLLILGTSEGMVNKIAQRLELPLPSRIINIEDVASPREIARARLIRERYGKHVVPAPTVALKPKFSGTVIDPLHTWLRRRNSQSRRLWVEQSVVRPTFNFLGNFYISNYVLEQMVSYVVKSISGIYRSGKIQILEASDGITIQVDLVMDYGVQLLAVAKEAQIKTVQTVEYMTSLHVKACNMIIRSLHVD